MSVKIMAPVGEKELYTEAEVQALVTSANQTVANQWEKYTLPLNHGLKTGWDLNTFFLNKHTGMATGLLGIDTWGGLANTTIGTNANLARHSAMPLAWCEYMEYGAPNGGDASWRRWIRNFNIQVTDAGVFTIEGIGAGVNEVKTNFNSGIWNFSYISKKYGIVTTTDVQPLYLPEGTFYDKNSMNLITGRAWLKKVINNPAGYEDGSHVTLFKNLWSGEVIMQYSLYPTNQSAPASINIGTRYNMYNNYWVYQPPRYLTPGTGADFDIGGRYRNCMGVLDGVLYFTNRMCAYNWITGTNYWVGNPELPPAFADLGTKLWIPESSEIVTGANSLVFAPFTTNSGTKFNFADIGPRDWFSSDYYPRCGTDTTHSQSCPRSFAVRAKSGMIYTYWDFTIGRTAMPVGNYVTAKTFGGAWVPTVRYSSTNQSSVSVYYIAPSYIGQTTTDIAGYQANLYFRVGDSANPPYLRWGSAAGVNGLEGCLICASGHFLGGD